MKNNKIEFKNGSVIKGIENAGETIRGKRASINSYLDPDLSPELFIDNKTIEEVLSKFINNNRGTPEIDQDIYLSSANNKEYVIGVDLASKDAIDNSARVYYKRDDNGKLIVDRTERL